MLSLSMTMMNSYTIVCGTKDIMHNQNFHLKYHDGGRKGRKTCWKKERIQGGTPQLKLKRQYKNKKVQRDQGSE